jgi:anti-sigma B factor antagonist
VAQNGQGPLLSVTVEQQVLWTIVRVTGELDYGTQSQLGDCLLTLIRQAEQPRICVDVRGLEFCDSAGMACLVVAWKVARTRGGSLVLLRPRARLGRKLAVIGLTAMLTVAAELPVPYQFTRPSTWASRRPSVTASARR